MSSGEVTEGSLALCIRFNNVKVSAITIILHLLPTIFAINFLSVELFDELLIRIRNQSVQF